MPFKYEGELDYFHTYTAEEVTLLLADTKPVALVAIGAKFLTKFRNLPPEAEVKYTLTDYAIGGFYTGKTSRLGVSFNVDIFGGQESPQLIAKGNATVVSVNGEFIPMRGQVYIHPIMEEADIRLAVVDGLCACLEV